VLLAAGAVVYFAVSPSLPKDNVVHVVLGAAAAHVVEVRLRYAPAAKHAPMAEEWTREASFRFPEGSAPRVVTHEPRAADGEYVVEIEIVRASHESTTLQRRVALAGRTTSIDVSEAVGP
jgi:hypothetical protein